MDVGWDGLGLLVALVFLTYNIVDGGWMGWCLLTCSTFLTYNIVDGCWMGWDAVCLLAALVF